MTKTRLEKRTRSRKKIIGVTFEQNEKENFLFFLDFLNKRIYVPQKNEQNFKSTD